MIKIKKLGIELNITEQSDKYLENFWKVVYPNNWESSTFDSIIPKLDKDKVFLDIGAWQGPISLIVQKYVSKCICFEPDPLAFKNLQDNIKLNKFNNIVAENKAVSSDESLTIGDNNSHPLGRGISSFLNNKRNTIKCDTISVGEILEKYNLNNDNISVLKMDVEGYEVELLSDSELKKLNVDMHISFHPHLFKDKEYFFKSVSDYLPQNRTFPHGRSFDLFIPKEI